MTPPDSGKREVCRDPECPHPLHGIARITVSLPLSLAQRILAALEVEAYAKAGEEEYRAVFRTLAAELREHLPKEPK